MFFVFFLFSFPGQQFTVEDVQAILDNSDIELSGSEDDDEPYAPNIDSDVANNSDDVETSPSTSAATGQRQQQMRVEIKWRSLNKKTFDPGKTTWTGNF